MNKKLKVFFNPGVHPQFDEIINYPPKDVEYKISRPQGDHNDDKIRKKRNLIAKLHRTGFPRMKYYKEAKDCDLIHSTRAIIPLFSKKPWILDMESGAAFTGLDWKSLKNPLAKFIIRRALLSKNCKKIIPQSDAAKNTLLENINCKGFEDKIETLYLAWHSNKLKRKKSDKLRISFIGRDYYIKGGDDVQEAFKILDKKYPGKISLKMKCNKIPENKKIDHPNVKYLKRIDDQKEFYDEVFGDCDIYIQPTIVDSYGVSILEAMSTGLPIICTDDFTFPELIKNGQNGYLVKSPINWYPYFKNGKHKEYMKIAERGHPETVKEIVNRVSFLFENQELMKKMGENNYKLINSGKFSIKERNRKLRKIYEEALK